MTDADAVQSSLQGDPEAFSILVERYRRTVHGLAFHFLQHDEEARDAAQETFVTAYCRLSQLRDPAGFGPWLRAIAANVCRMKQRRSRPALPLEEHLMSPAETDRWATRLTVRRAMESLSEDARLTLSLYYASSYSIEEIGAFLAEPVTTIKSRLRNARARLRKELDQFVEDALKPDALPPDFGERVLGMVRAARRGDLGTLQSLAGADPRLLNARDSLGNSPLVEATNAGHVDAARALADSGAVMDVWAAASAGDVDRLRSLLQSDSALAHAFSLQGFTPLHLAAHFGKTEVMRVLLELGAEPNVVSRHPLRVTPLHAALFGEREEAALLLLAHGADPNTARNSPGHDRDGWTPMHYAASAGLARVTKALLTLGADPDQPDACGRTAADVAEKSILSRE